MDKIPFRLNRNVAWVSLALVACDPKNSELDEGQENPFVRDPWANLPNQDTNDTGTNPPDDLSEIPDPEPADVTVCYFGPDRDNSQCIETVEHNPDWGDSYSYPDPYQGSEQYLAPVRYIDLLTADENLILAPNFVLGELMSAQKGRFGLFSPLVVETLQYIRDDLGGPLVISSAYRNVSYNAGVGGVTYSRHLYGDAVDLQTQMTDLNNLAELCELYVASFVSVYESHVHCDWRDDPLEPAFYEASDVQSSVAPPQIIWSIEGWTTTNGPYDEGHPLREWTAFDLDGTPLAHEVSRHFVAPENTKSIAVVVGTQFKLSLDFQSR